jgi:bacterioferritin
MTNEVVIEELNTLLRGTYMGIRSLEHYIQKTNNKELKHFFQKIQQEQKENAQKIAARIQNLGGVPADSEGFTGSITSFMHNMMLPDQDQKIIEDAVKGFEKYGVQYSEELVRGDLDPESRQMVAEIINDSRRHAEQLKNLLH